MSAPPRRRFFFVFIQKTGSTSLDLRLRRLFGDACYPPAQGERAWPVWELAIPSLLVARWPSHRDGVEVITGHYPPCTVELLGDEFTMFTVLRDPVERTLSFLRHWAERNERFAGWPLERIYDDRDLRRSRLVNDHMVSMLSLTPDRVDFGLGSYLVDRRAAEESGSPEGVEPDLAEPSDVGPTELARAKEQLLAMEVVGVQEHLEAFCAELSQRFGWDLGPPVRANTTDPVRTSRSFRRRVAQDNALDEELYELARERSPR